MSTWTNERHEAARARCEAATEGPWDDQPNRTDTARVVLDGDGEVLWDAAGLMADADSEFIAHARTDLPDALDEIERLRALTTITKDRVRAAGREFWLSGAKDRAWAEAAWDDMGGGEPCEERALAEIAAERALEAALKETK